MCTTAGWAPNVSLAAEGSTFGKPINEKAQQLVDLLSKADTETDLAKRKALYEQAQEVYADLVVTMPLFFQAEHVIYRSNIQGSIHVRHLPKRSTSAATSNSPIRS